MNTKYLNNPDYNFEKVNRASLACGPMVKWAIAQVSTGSFSHKKSVLVQNIVSLVIYS